MAKKRRPIKLRTEFKKNYQQRRRQSDLTRKFQQESLDEDSLTSRERVSGKGDLTRHRTIVGHFEETEDGLSLEVDEADGNLRYGRVLRMHGLECVVRCEDGTELRCTIRQVLKSLSTDQRHVVVAGDLVAIRRENASQGIVVSVRQRHGVLSRTSKGKRHILVSNVDQLLIVASASEPDLKPHLIDRFLVSAEQSGLDALIVINKADLVDCASLQTLIGVYAQMGYRLLLTSASKGWGIEWLRQAVYGRQSVVAGQSGVGKSSLLNAIQAGLGLRVQTVSAENMKGRHTTTTTELLPLEGGGYLVDTPGIRQLELWDIIPEEVAGLFRDLRPYVSGCRFPDCTHIHEVGCAVQEAVADGRIDPRRYNSYVHLFEDPSASD